MTSASAPDGISTATTRSRVRIHCGDGFSVEPAHRRAEAGAEDGVDQNIRIKDRAGGFSLQLVVFDTLTAGIGSLVNISAASPRTRIAPPAITPARRCPLHAVCGQRRIHLRRYFPFHKLRRSIEPRDTATRQTPPRPRPRSPSGSAREHRSVRWWRGRSRAFRQP